MKLFRVAAAVALMTTLCAGRGFSGGDASIEETVGSSHYAGTKLKGSVDVTDQVYLQPYFRTYHSDLSDGSHSLFSARVGYDAKSWDAGGTLGFSPKVNGYGNSFFGVDGTLYFDPTDGKLRRKSRDADPDAESFGAGLTEAFVGGELTFTNHSDDFQFVRSGPGKGVKTRNGTVHIGETDFGLNAGLKFTVASVKVDVMKSAYGQDLDSINARSAQAVELQGLNAEVQGFPDTSFNATGKLLVIPRVTPYLSYTHTTFRLGNPPANSVAAGATADISRLMLKAGVERVTQDGFPTLNLLTLGVGVRF